MAAAGTAVAGSTSIIRRTASPSRDTLFPAVVPDLDTTGHRYCSDFGSYRRVLIEGYSHIGLRADRQQGDWLDKRVYRVDGRLHPVVYDFSGIIGKIVVGRPSHYLTR